MKAKSIVLDVDGCLVEKLNRYTVPEDILLSRFEEVKNKRATININSNRPLSGIIPVYLELSFNGAIIAENGAIYYHPLEIETFTSLEDCFDRNLLDSVLKKSGYKVVYNNIVEIFSSPKEVAERFSEGEKIVFADDDRTYNMALFPRKVKNGELTWLFDDLEGLCNSLKSSFNNFNVSGRSLFCGVSVEPSILSKALFMGRFEKPVASFGDTMQDWSMMQVSDYIGCPANSQDKLKDKVRGANGFISEKSYTEGVVDFLDYLND